MMHQDCIEVDTQCFRGGTLMAAGTAASRAVEGFD